METIKYFITLNGNPAVRVGETNLYFDAYELKLVGVDDWMYDIQNDRVAEMLLSDKSLEKELYGFLKGKPVKRRLYIEPDGSVIVSSIGHVGHYRAKSLLEALLDIAYTMWDPDGIPFEARRVLKGEAVGRLFLHETVDLFTD
jgi:hypothetical protein